MKIHEITEGQLTELDVRGGLASLGNTIKDYVRPQAEYDEYKEFYPKDDAHNYYDDTEFRYEAATGKWINTETERTAWPVAQQSLMNKYGFTGTGRPTTALKRRIAAKKRRGSEPTKKFTGPDAQKIYDAFNNAFTVYNTSGDMAKYFANAKMLAGYIAQGYDLKSLQKVNSKRMQDLFPVTGGATMTALYTALFVKPDATAVNTAITGYTSGRPPVVKTMTAANDAKVKQTITDDIGGLDTAKISKIPGALEKIKDTGYDITPYTALVQTEVAKLVDAASRYTDIGDVSAFLDTLIVLKPALPPIAATFGAKLNALKFETMFPPPGINTRDLAALTQKRTKALAP